MAENPPQTIYETAKQLSKTKKGMPRNYKSSWTAFKALERKGFIKPTKSKNCNSKKYSCSWLTETGVLLALHEGAEPEAILKITRKIHPENKDLHLIIEAAPILGPHVMQVIYLAAINRGKIEQTDLIAIFAAQIQDKFTPEQITRFIQVFKKYPEQHQRARKNLRELADLL
jgi:hypothetical protein